MLRDESVVVESSWACSAGEEPWRDLDRQLRSVAERRGALDHEELTLIREAIAMQLWRPLGMTSMREYLERRMGYGPQVAAERLRVAEALDALPAIEAALANGELSYSAVRELTRIATRKTDAAWVKACRGKVVSEIQEMVAEREPGDPPDGKPKPQLRRRRFCADLLPDVDALVRQARQVIEAEHGEKLDNDELMRAFVARVLEPAVASDKPQRPRHQIAVTVCKACKQGWQNGAGREIPISAIDLEVALCDAQHVGGAGAPGKLTQTIPAATRRFVWRRDHGRCRIPGCRAACFIDVHHLVPRELGGTHDVSNLVLLCAGHHRALHAGLLVIEGSAPDFKVVWLTEVPHVGEFSLDDDGDIAASQALCDASTAGHPGASGPAVRVAEVPHVGDEALGNESVDVDRSEASLAEPAAVRVAEVPHVGDEALGNESVDVDRSEASLAEARADRSRFPHVGDRRSPIETGAAMRAGTSDRKVADASSEPSTGALAAISGRPVRTTRTVPHVGEPHAPDDLDDQHVADVQAGLVRLGFRRDEARAAVARAHARVGRGADVETLLRAALRECPRTS